MQHKRDRDILFRVHSPGAVWRELNNFYSPKTSGAKLALIEKYDNVKFSVRDDPVQKLIEMEEVARQLRAFDTDINLTGSHTLLIFVNALPPKYDHQRQSMEEHDTLTREIVVGLVLNLSNRPCSIRTSPRGRRPLQVTRPLLRRASPASLAAGAAKGRRRSPRTQAAMAAGARAKAETDRFGRSHGGDSSARRRGTWRDSVLKRTVRYVVRRDIPCMTVRRM